MKKTSFFFRRLCMLLCLVLTLSSLGGVSAAGEPQGDIYVRPLVGGVAQIAMSPSHVAVLRSDGTVRASGNNDWGQCKVDSWSRVVKLWVAEGVTVGLTKEGTVFTTCVSMPTWHNIRDVAVMRSEEMGVIVLVGLKEDGTAIQVCADNRGQCNLGPGVCDVRGWKELVQIVTTDRIYGLSADGTVREAGFERELPEVPVAKWRNVRELVSSGGEIFGITDSGAVLSERDGYGGESWKDIAKVTLGAGNVLYGLTRDGKVRVGGANFSVLGLTGLRDAVGTDKRCVALRSDGQVIFSPDQKNAVNREAWKNVEELIYSPGGSQVAGLRYDGTVVAAHIDDLNKKADCDGWTDIARLYCDGARWMGIREDGSLVANFKNVDLKSLTAGIRETKPENYSVGLMAAGIYHSVYVRSDGRISAAGLRSDGRLNVTDWTDIAAVSAYDHTVGLKNDGTVLAVGSNAYNQCDVRSWKDIVDISAGGMNTIGLTSKGNVVVAGSDLYGQLKLAGRRNVVDVEASGAAVYALSSKGTVAAAGSNAHGECEVSDWTDIIAISAGTTHVVGIRSDGTVVAAGSNDFGQCDVSGWTDVIMVSAGGTHTVGLRANGSLLFAGSNTFGQGDLSGWKNVVAIDTGMYHTLGLTASGGILTTGSNGHGQCNIGH